MKEKIKKIFRFLLNNWTTFVEIGVVVWAINGIMTKYRSFSLDIFVGSTYHITPVWAYFLSAALILYLTRRYKKKS